LKDTEFNWLAAFKWAGGVLASLWGRLPLLLQSLLVLMALDIASGLIAGYITRSLSSDVSWRGMAKKSLVLLLIAACEILQRTWNLGLPLASAVVGFYIVHEMISIVENTARAGLPMPRALTSALRKLRAQSEEGENA
jgi:toxin secretion/phage lysis holin